MGYTLSTPSSPMIGLSFNSTIIVHLLITRISVDSSDHNDWKVVSNNAHTTNKKVFYLFGTGDQ